MKRFLCFVFLAALLSASVPVAAITVSFDPGPADFTVQQAARMEELLAQMRDTFDYHYYIVVLEGETSDPTALAEELLAQREDAANSILTMYLEESGIAVTVEGANIPVSLLRRDALQAINRAYMSNRGKSTAEKAVLSLEQMIYQIYKSGNYPTTPLIDEIVGGGSFFDKYSAYILGGLGVILVVEIVITARKKDFKRGAKGKAPGDPQGDKETV